jgi:hypothetical protein
MTLLLMELACPVRCPAFRRSSRSTTICRLKAGHQTGSVSGCTSAKGGRP